MQLPLPGFSIPPLPESFSGMFLTEQRSFPYVISFDRTITALSHTCSDDGLIRITAPASLSPSEVRRIVQREQENYIRSVLDKKAKDNSLSLSGMVNIRDLSIPYTVECSRKRKVISLLLQNGNLIVKTGIAVNSGEVLDVIYAEERWIYQQILEYRLNKQVSDQEHFLQIGSEHIPYLIEYRTRIKRLTLKVSPLMPVTVVAPLRYTQKEIHTFITSHIIWIAEKLGRSDLLLPVADISSTLSVAGAGIPYRVQYSARVKRISIRIQPDKTVLVVAPQGIELSLISQFVSQKSGWIIKKITDSRPVIPVRTYQDGDLLPVLGKDVHLTVCTGELRPEAYLSDAGIIIQIPAGLSSNASRELIKQGYRKIIEDTMDIVTPELIRHWSLQLGIPVPQVKYGDQKTRWGVCTPKGIILNIRLAMAPVNLIEYVIVHELCHIRHHNHSKKFWNLVGQMLPGYLEIRSLLKRDGVLYSF